MNARVAVQTLSFQSPVPDRSSAQSSLEPASLGSPPDQDANLPDWALPPLAPCQKGSLPCSWPPRANTQSPSAPWSLAPNQALPTPRACASPWANVFSTASSIAMSSAPTLRHAAAATLQDTVSLQGQYTLPA